MYHGRRASQSGPVGTVMVIELAVSSWSAVVSSHQSQTVLIQGWAGSEVAWGNCIVLQMVVVQSLELFLKGSWLRWLFYHAHVFVQFYKP